MTIGLLLLFLVAPSSATEAGITVLLSREGDSYNRTFEGFREFLRKSGVEATYDVIQLEGNVEKAQAVFGRIREHGSDLIVTIGSFATDTALKEKFKIPLVAAMTTGEQALKDAKNATGVVINIPVKEQVSFLKRFLPHVTTVGVMYSPSQNQGLIETAVKETKKLNLELEPYAIYSPKEIPGALKTLGRRVDVLWGIPDSTVVNAQTARHLLLYSYRNKIPFIGLSSPWVKSGALYAVDRDYHDIGTQAGEMVLKILKGTGPHSISPETPRKLVYSLNLKTAEHMKIELSQKIIRDAHEVF